MSTFISVDPASMVPPFAQILDQLRAMIQRGDLQPGDHLPTVRQLAADLNVAPNTVAKAFSQLESEAWVRTDGRRGTIVTAGAKDTTKSRNAALRDAVAQFIAAMSTRGYTKHEVRQVIESLV